LDRKPADRAAYDPDMLEKLADPDVLPDLLAADGFAFLLAADARRLLSHAGSMDDWDAFRESWNEMPLDEYMADGGRYRRRRHAVYAALADGSIVREPHQPHYQALEYNPLNGGIPRWFAPIDDTIGTGATLSAILRFARTTFERVAPTRRWRVEVHQFRIEARAGERGRPTPEGVHRDGVDYVIVLLVDRVNVRSGTTTIHALDGTPLGSFTLATPLDGAVLDDSRVAHGVTPIEPLDPARPAYRDVLVVTFRKPEDVPARHAPAASTQRRADGNQARTAE
jgi:hypothetical protein